MGIIREAIRKHLAGQRVNGAMPGHKGRLDLPIELDVTELPGLDNLQQPEGILAAAQDLVAETYGVKGCRFLVNGASCGNLTLLFSFFQEGDRILVERNCHKSVHHGLELRKLNPVYLWPQPEDLSRGLPMGGARLGEALRAHPDIKGVFLTQPSYEGYYGQLAKIARLCQKAGVPLLLDAAHGAALPKSAAFYGLADGLVISAHKSLACPNQSALLLYNRQEKADQILKYSNYFQTTSPSYPMMAAMEEAVQAYGAGSHEMSPRPPDLQSIQVNPRRSDFHHDGWKWLLVRPGAGRLMADWLEARGIFVEFALQDTALIMLSPKTSQAELSYLRACLLELDETLEGEAAETSNTMPQPPKLCLKPWQIRGEGELVPLKQAVGRLAQAPVTPYPPGVPSLLPGEAISQDMVDYLQELDRTGSQILGLYQGKIRCVKGDLSWACS